jgi:hypothetical protein
MESSAKKMLKDLGTGEAWGGGGWTNPVTRIQKWVGKFGPIIAQCFILTLLFYTVFNRINTLRSCNLALSKDFCCL